MIVSGFVADIVRTKHLLQTTNVRKVFNAVGKLASYSSVVTLETVEMSFCEFVSSTQKLWLFNGVNYRHVRGQYAIYVAMFLRALLSTSRRSTVFSLKRSRKYGPARKTHHRLLSVQRELE